MGYHGHEVAEDKLKTFRHQRHHPLSVTYESTLISYGPAAGCHKAGHNLFV